MDLDELTGRLRSAGAAIRRRNEEEQTDLFARIDLDRLDRALVEIENVLAEIAAALGHDL